METFSEIWSENSGFRNIFILITSTGAFIITYSIRNDLQNINLINFSLLFYSIVSFWMMIEWLFSGSGLDHVILVSAVMTIVISIYGAVILNESNIIVGGATIVLVIVTAFNTIKMDRIAEKQRLTQIEPLVLLIVKENDLEVQIIDLIIENVGAGIAKNLRFTINPHDFISISGDPLERLFFFQSGIQILPPKQKYVIHMTDLPKKIEEIKRKYRIADPVELRRKLKEELQLNIIINYEDIEGNHKINEFFINLCIFWGLRYPSPQHDRIPSNAIASATSDFTIEG
jgi:hypothetical protein